MFNVYGIAIPFIGKQIQCIYVSDDRDELLRIKRNDLATESDSYKYDVYLGSIIAGSITQTTREVSNEYSTTNTTTATVKYADSNTEKKFIHSTIKIPGSSTSFYREDSYGVIWSADNVTHYMCKGTNNTDLYASKKPIIRSNGMYVEYDWNLIHIIESGFIDTVFNGRMVTLAEYTYNIDGYLTEWRNSKTTVYYRYEEVKIS